MRRSRTARGKHESQRRGKEARERERKKKKRSVVSAYWSVETRIPNTYPAFDHRCTKRCAIMTERRTKGHEQSGSQICGTQKQNTYKVNGVEKKKVCYIFFPFLLRLDAFVR